MIARSSRSMIVIDTNVISEMMKPLSERSSVVFDWLETLQPESVFTTAVSVAEIGAGLHQMPTGKRRDGMVAAAQRVFSEVFEGRVLPFDHVAAELYGRMSAARRRKGLHHDHSLDLQIAAIAGSYIASVATRDVNDFVGLELKLINPWDHPAP